MKRGNRKKAKKVVTIVEEESAQADEENANAQDNNQDESDVTIRGRKVINKANIADNTLLGDIGRQFGITVPYASDLISADYFRLTNMEIPTSSKPHMANRQSFLRDYFSNQFHHDEAVIEGKEIIRKNNKYPLKEFGAGTDAHTICPPLFLSKLWKNLLSPKYKEEPNASWYLSELFRISCSVSTSMLPRIRSMRPYNNYSSDIDSPPEEKIAVKYSAAAAKAAEHLNVSPMNMNSPEFNIVVIDVFVEIPRPKLKEGIRNIDNGIDDEDSSRPPSAPTNSMIAVAVDSPKNENSLTSNLKSMFVTKNKKTDTSKEFTPPPIPKLDIALHQVIGVFPSTLPRAPPSVDMSLLSWDLILNRAEVDEVAPKTTAYGRSGTSNAKSKETNTWSTSRSLPGSKHSLCY